jgi:TonB family protein
VILLPRERSSRRSTLKRGLLSTVLAVLAHGVIALLLMFLSLLHLHVPPEHRAPSNSNVVLRGLSAETWAKNRGDAPKELQNKDDRKQAQREQPERKKQEKKPPEQAPGQVVATAPGNGQEDPNAKFASETSNKVQKQTKAKDQTAFYRNAMPKRTSNVPQDGNGTDSVDKAQVAGNGGIGQDDRPLREGKKKMIVEVPDIKKRSEIAMRETNPNGAGVDIANRSETEEVHGNSQRMRIQPGSEGEGDDTSSGKSGEPGVANLLPSPAVLDKIVGAAANDHLADVDDGEGTYLNTKEWKYASFFNRVKQSVGQHWNPGGQLRLRDPTGNIYGGRDRYTVLNVTLNDQGRVREVFVEKSCGLDFLDLEAIQSFERAQPFPNPPPGLVQADSSVKFQFGFFLEMSGSPRMHLFRSNN